MSRLLLSAAVVVLVGHAVSAAVQAPNVVTRESTVTATVDRVDRSSRLVLFRADGSGPQSVYVDRTVAAFDDLKPGDVVVVRYLESVIVQVRPNAKPQRVRDTTKEAKEAGGDRVISQTKAVVTVENIDVQTLLVSYRTEDGVRAMRLVQDKRLLEGLRTGDRIEITATRERAVDIRRK